jgi:DNA-binding MarR family transcriptional regulator
MPRNKPPAVDAGISREILAFIVRSDGATVCEIARTFGVSRQYVTARLHELRRAGYIARIPRKVH